MFNKLYKAFILAADRIYISNCWQKVTAASTS